mgnify:CR=1 FL=1
MFSFPAKLICKNVLNFFNRDINTNLRRQLEAWGWFKLAVTKWKSKRIFTEQMANGMKCEVKKPHDNKKAPQ